MQNPEKYLQIMQSYVNQELASEKSFVSLPNMDRKTSLYVLPKTSELLDKLRGPIPKVQFIEMLVGWLGRQDRMVRALVLNAIPEEYEGQCAELVLRRFQQAEALRNQADAHHRAAMGQERLDVPGQPDGTGTHPAQTGSPPAKRKRRGA